MHSTVFFKEHEGIVPDPINGSPSEVPLWSGLGSLPPPPAAAAYGNTSVQSNLPSLELSAVGNHQFTVAKEPEDHQHGLAKGNTTQFALFSGNNFSNLYIQTFSSILSFLFYSFFFFHLFNTGNICSNVLT